MNAWSWQVLRGQWSRYIDRSVFIHARRGEHRRASWERAQPGRSEDRMERRRYHAREWGAV